MDKNKQRIQDWWRYIGMIWLLHDLIWLLIYLITLNLLFNWLSFFWIVIEKALFRLNWWTLDMAMLVLDVLLFLIFLDLIWPIYFKFFEWYRLLWLVWWFNALMRRYRIQFVGFYKVIWFTLLNVSICFTYLEHIRVVCS